MELDLNIEVLKEVDVIEKRCLQAVNSNRRFIFASRSWPSVTATTRFVSLRPRLKLETSHLIQVFCFFVFRSSVRSVLSSSVDMDDRSMDRK